MRSGIPVLNRVERTADAQGHEYWLLTTKVPLHSSEGEVCGVTGASIAIEPPSPIEGIVGLSRDITAIKNLEKEREHLINKLQEALGKIKTLRGLIPICASCKKIRDDSGFWQQVEVYVHNHSAADFSHSLCPDCARKYVAELEDRGGDERADRK